MGEHHEDTDTPLCPRCNHAAWVVHGETFGCTNSNCGWVPELTETREDKMTDLLKRIEGVRAYVRDQRIGYEADNVLKDDGTPGGGSVQSIGLDIRWQDGSIKADEARNGTTPEEVQAAILQRWMWLNGLRANEETVQLLALGNAIMSLAFRRHEDRALAKLDGTDAPELHPAGQAVQRG